MAQLLLLVLCACICTQAKAQEVQPRSPCQEVFFNSDRENELNTLRGEAVQAGFCLDVELDTADHQLDVRAGVEEPRSQCNGGNRNNNQAACNAAYETQADGMLAPCVLSGGTCQADESQAAYCAFASPDTCRAIYNGDLQESISMNANYIARCADVPQSECVDGYVVPIVPFNGVYSEENENTFITCAFESGSCTPVGPIKCKPRASLEQRRERRKLQGTTDACGEAATSETACGRLYTYVGGSNDFLSDSSIPPPDLAICEWDSDTATCATKLTCPYSCEVVGRNLPRTVAGRIPSDLSVTFSDSVLDGQAFCSTDWFRRNKKERCEAVYTTVQASSGSPHDFVAVPCAFDDSNFVSTCGFGPGPWCE